MPDVRRVIVKIGSATLTIEGGEVNRPAIANLAAQIAQLRVQGIEVALVASGAVAAGMHALGLTQRPSESAARKGLAAVGQTDLLTAFREAFAGVGITTGQLLQTPGDLLHVRNTLDAMFEQGVVPIINENDPVKNPTQSRAGFGDNDTHAARVAEITGADLVALLTDIEGLFTANPRTHPDAVFISEGRAGDPALLAMAGDAGTAVGTGGMRTKVLAAQIAARGGTATVIANGQAPNVLPRILAGEPVGTLLLPPEGWMPGGGTAVPARAADEAVTGPAAARGDDATGQTRPDDGPDAGLGPVPVPTPNRPAPTGTGARRTPGDGG